MSENDGPVTGTVDTDRVDTDTVDTDTVDKSETITEIRSTINKNLLSSQLFILPSIYGYYTSYTAVMIGSIICLITSTANHYHKAVNKKFNIIYFE